MKKLTFICLAAAAFLLCACRTTPYEIKEEDKLTDREKYHLFDYSRTFILSSKKVKLSNDDKRFLMSKDPDVRVHYTGPKTGNLSLSWLIPGRIQIIVSASGRLDLSGSKQADWGLRVIHYKRDCYMLPEEIGIPAVD